MPRRRFTRLLANLLLLAVASALSLGLAELLVRRLAPQHLPLAVALRNLHRPDPELGYVMVPGFHRYVHTAEFACDVRTNALGMRDHEIAPRRAGRLRVLGLGDSFLFGIHAGVLDSCFAKRLEATLDGELRAHPVPGPEGARDGVEILNAGVDGYGTLQEVGLLHRLGPVLQPDAVLVAFYLGNDFTDNSGRTRMTVVDGYQMLEASAAPYREEFRPLQRRARLWLHAHSELYQLVKARLLHPARRAVTAPSDVAAATKSFDYYLYDAGFAACLRDSASADLQRGLDATREAFLDLRHWCDAHGARALVVALPAEQQVSDAARRRWIERFGLDARSLDFGLPNRRLAALAAEAGLAFYDLTPGFAARVAAGADLHLHGDNHWNAAGHAVAANLLADPLLETLTGTGPPLVGTR